MADIRDAFSHLGAAATSFSTYATIQVAKFRDKEDEYGHAQAMETPEMVGRLIVAELGFALLCVVSIIETVARAALSLIAVPIALILQNCFEQYELAEKIGMASLGGCIFSAQNVANCAVALIANFYCNETLKYNELIPCLQEYNDQIPNPDIFRCV